MRPYFSAFLIVIFAITGCREAQDSLPPVIILEQQVYEAMAGETVTVSPSYENCENATYLWTCDGKTLSEEPVLTFSSDVRGEFYILLTATNAAGSARAEVGIFVYEQMPPQVTLIGAAAGFTVLQDSVLVLSPEIESPLPYECAWTIDGTVVSEEDILNFPTAETGLYEVVFSVKNSDGSAELEFAVEVLSPADAFSWTFPADEYSLSSGREILLSPTDIAYDFDAAYTWAVDGVAVQTSESPEYLFDRTGEGEYEVTVTMRNSYTEASHSLRVLVCPPEGHYKRPADAGSKAEISTVFEYTPAPGQFINENFTATTAEEACAYASDRLSQGQFVSLGAFGGYITVGFDHSVENGGEGSLDLQITGNAHSSSSEPGIIWVSQDENGNGLPDDTWYELRGSEYGKPETWQDYAVTYYRPSGNGMAVEWQDNRGQWGTIDYLPAYHDQDSYFPAWITSGSYTLRGTRLEDRLVDENGNGSLWVGHPFGWGYADNWSDSDPDIDKFSISNAVRWDGAPADLAYIDFVRIQCGVQAKGGWTGEQSTEITVIRDLHL